MVQRPNKKEMSKEFGEVVVVEKSQSRRNVRERGYEKYCKKNHQVFDNIKVETREGINKIK